jgi:arabinose-5-phosphate isomerase
LRLVPFFLEQHIPIIGISGRRDSLLAKNSTCFLNVAVEHEACPLNLAPTSSTTATLAMGDALACALIEVRHFRPQDFAQFHPGGSLGKRLLTTARDVMRSDDLPVIPPTMKLGEAIIHVSKGKLGLCVAVVNDCIVGIITDGDVRRAMQHSQDKFFTLTVADIMTRTPKVVSPTTKIDQIQLIMHKNKIHSVLVVDDNGHLLGVVDHFSCML